MGLVAAQAMNVFFVLLNLKKLWIKKIVSLLILGFGLKSNQRDPCEGIC